MRMVTKLYFLHEVVDPENNFPVKDENSNEVVFP